MTQPIDPTTFELPPALASFLAGSRTVLVGRIDCRGTVLAANPALRRWVGEGPSLIESALSPRSAVRWLRRLAEFGQPGDSRTMVLQFHRGRSRQGTYRCLLVPQGEGSHWLIG